MRFEQFESFQSAHHHSVPKAIIQYICISVSNDDVVFATFHAEIRFVKTEAMKNRRLFFRREQRGNFHRFRFQMLISTRYTIDVTSLILPVPATTSTITCV